MANVRFFVSAQCFCVLVSNKATTNQRTTEPNRKGITEPTKATKRTGPERPYINTLRTKCPYLSIILLYMQQKQIKCIKIPHPTPIRHKAH